MDSLIQLIYSSAAAKLFREDDLPELLSKARIANTALGITGMLVYINGNFLQVLEGPEAVVNQLFAKIGKDPRHKGVFEYVREPIATRTFTEWSMGFQALLLADVEMLIGENDFFDLASCVDGIGCGNAKRILQSFRQVQTESAMTERNVRFTVDT